MSRGRTPAQPLSFACLGRKSTLMRSELGCRWDGFERIDWRIPARRGNPVLGFVQPG